MKKPSVPVTGLLILLGVLWLIGNVRDWQGVLFFTAFSLGPLLFNLVPAFLFRSRAAQGIILFASLAYAAWLIFVWYQAFVLHPDPQSPIALVFAGLYAMPIMMLLWLAALVAAGIARRNALCTTKPEATETELVNSAAGQAHTAGPSTAETDNPYQPPQGF